MTAAPGMRVAYLMSQYPKTSHTFIAREVAALERLGFTVLRWALRPPGRLDGVCDGAELARTRFVLGVGPARLAWACLLTLAASPGRARDAVVMAVRLGWRSDRGLLVHAVYLAEACVVRRWCARERVVHVHAHFGANAAAVALLSRVLGGPAYSFTLHGPDELDRAPVLGLGSKVAHARFVAAISEYARSQAFRWCDPRHWDRVHVVRCGVDAAYLATPTTPVPDVPRLVTVGRLNEQKGHLLLVDAAADLAAAGRAFELVLVGDGELRAAVTDRVAALGLAGRVRVVGWLDQARTRAAMAGARAVVLPSFAEGLPVVLMEAMALGRPVVASRVAGVPELVVDGTGWLVTPGSRAELVAAMAEVLAAPVDALTAMGRRGREQVEARHDADVEAARLAALLRGDRVVPDAEPRPAGSGAPRPA